MPPLAAFHTGNPRPAAELEGIQKKPANVMKRKREEHKNEGVVYPVKRRFGSMG